MKYLVKHGRTIKGFVYQDNKGDWYYVIGKPSQTAYMSIGCKDKEDGIANINRYHSELLEVTGYQLT